jgi:hypothetical protein
MIEVAVNYQVYKIKESTFEYFLAFSLKNKK